MLNIGGVGAHAEALSWVFSGAHMQIAPYSPKLKSRKPAEELIMPNYPNLKEVGEEYLSPVDKN